MLYLPYLKLKTWRFRWRLVGRSLGWRQAMMIENGSYVRRVVRSAWHYLPVAAPLRVQAHPKNESHHGLIERLLAPLRPDAALQGLRSTDLLEVRLSSGWFSEAS
jgi:hypothetical protein